MKGNNFARIRLQRNFSKVVDVENITASAVADSYALIIFEANNAVANRKFNVTFNRIMEVTIGNAEGKFVRQLTLLN